MIYAFDVDGTLTPSRGQMDARFQLWFTRFTRSHTVCLVTGSDHAKTVEQVGEMIVRLSTYTFNCSGSDVYYYGSHQSTNSWTCPDHLWSWLETQLYQSPYRHRYGRHFETRPGMLNFSIVGRDARGEERTNYFDWDKTSGERARLASLINERFPEVHATVGGETGIDIGPVGADKSQILTHFGDSPVTFFGDRCDPDGNDYPLARALWKREGSAVHSVSGWKDTWDILKKIEETNYEYAEKISRQRVKGDSTYAVIANR